MKSSVSSLLFRVSGLFALLAGLLAPQPPASVRAATRTDIAGPAGSGQFGYAVTILPNGNWVVIDPFYDKGKVVDVGAVYLYDGTTSALISKLTGSTASDKVGSNGIQVLPNGMFLILSANWSNGFAMNAGAVTWCSIETGCSGVVSPANSLVGSRWDDQVGNSGITVMANGSYIVRSILWDNNKYVDAGAVTWCSSETGCVAAVSATNSLIGGRAGDHAGGDGIVVLRNGNFLVQSSALDNDQQIDAGAVTMCSGEIGCSGVITTTNSLIGSNTPRIGWAARLSWSLPTAIIWSAARHGTTTLPPAGVFPAQSPIRLDAGAVTWCSGETGCSGPITIANSLIGSTNYDRVASGGVIGLANTNYLVPKPDLGSRRRRIKKSRTLEQSLTAMARPAAPASSRLPTAWSEANSDQAGSYGITPLITGNYVVIRLPGIMVWFLMPAR